MNPFPDDIFTEPQDVDPDTLANLGPLRRLAGVWEGRRALGVSRLFASGLPMQGASGPKCAP